MDVATEAAPFAVPSLSDFDLAGKRVLIREDLNVPLEEGAVANGSRIDAALPTSNGAWPKARRCFSRRT